MQDYKDPQVVETEITKRLVDSATPKTLKRNINKDLPRLSSHGDSIAEINISSSSSRMQL